MHSFDPNIAQRVGISAAVIYQNIFWWCQKNAANDRNIIDGLAWSYNSVRAFTTLFPYLTAKQVRTALTVLEDEGLILVANHNADPRDRTKWYAIGAQNAVPDTANGSAPQGKAVCPPGQSTFAPQGEPLPVSKPDIKPDSKHYGRRAAAAGSDPGPQEGLFDLPPLREKARKQHVDDLAEGCQSTGDEFDQVWPHYPRKVKKAVARRAWIKARKTASFAMIADPLRVFIRIQQGTDLSSIPHFATWLNQERWNDDQTHARNRAETTSDRLDRLGAVSTGPRGEQLYGLKRTLPEIELRTD